IVHHLIAPHGVALKDIRRVHSHPVALAQCEKFLRANQQIEVVPAYDTAGSVKMIVENDSRDEAAIAGATAAAVYGADIIVESIEDNVRNYTRFLLLTRAELAASLNTLSRLRSDERKTSIVFRVANQPGA